MTESEALSCLAALLNVDVEYLLEGEESCNRAVDDLITSSENEGYYSGKDDGWQEGYDQGYEDGYHEPKVD